MKIDVRIANNFWKRAVGLLGSLPLNDQQGMLISPCNSIHTCFMRLPIDAVFIDLDGNIMRIVEHIRPWKFAAAKAHSCLELSAGNAARLGLKVDDCLAELAQPVTGKVIQIVVLLPVSTPHF
ncbi:DUF192 domain-containing protein [Glaciimonas sp. Gout2]|uniref:DUF192 domain-containing protein n=1 Tax=unclassified Glaciimonas TaxID=2644401 RepID=UPI002AB32EFC|nr:MULTISPECIES: DUF192 domain-containing protein [unclassified Glaciimonas]MDY7547401.1 DUF192 domain-containing protein [Glaciimonas sp. CA11.2]MEB0013584.1 DUF192 domain-containing protein [Glaciimonas sp. Cout2]MEB0083215.1 DUF192 domain-containing protein [Glaciimonas sp. Gout2]